MPRSAAKAQADKRGRRSSFQVTPPPVQEPAEEEMIHGLTKTQWSDLLIQEDSDDIIGEIMEELLSKVMAGCTQVYIKRQMIPFSAFWAKSYLTQIIEQQIMCLDEGEKSEARTEESEPMPTTFDTWAQGIVPAKDNTPQPYPTFQQMEDFDQVQVQMEPRISRQCNAEARPGSSPHQSTKGTSPRRPVIDESRRVFSPCPPMKTDRKKMQQIHLPPKLVHSKLLPPLSCPAEKKDIGVDSASWTHSVSLHSTGSSIAHKDQKPIPKLDPSSLPRHCIFPEYEIVDTNIKPTYKKPIGLSKLEAYSSKQQNDWSFIHLKPLISSKDEPKRRNERDIWLNKLSSSRQRRGGMSYSGPLKLDRMDLANGVSLSLDPDTACFNSLNCTSPTQSTNLRQIQNDAPVPLFSINQVTTGPHPQVTPLFPFRNMKNDNKIV